MVFRKRLVAAAVATALIVAALGVASTTIAAADRSGVACGDAITADTRLAADLVDCPRVGLVVAADGITLDLGGHRIDGDGLGDDVGIDVSGHHGVTIAHGTVRDFTEGVLIADSTQIALRGLTSADQAHGGITVEGASAVTIAGNVVRDAGAGIIVSHAERVLVSANHVSGSAFAGIATFDSQRVGIADNAVTSAGDAAIGLFDGSARNEVTGNRLSRSGAGVALNDGASGNLVAGNAIAHDDSGVIVDVGTHDNRVLDNTVTDSSFEGIALVGSDRNLLAGNVVARNGAVDPAGGIVLIAWPDDPSQTSDANTVAGNATLDNGGDGIHVERGQPGNLLRGNRADRNTRLGIDAAPGTVDGGANSAAHNGDRRQCVGVVCA